MRQGIHLFCDLGFERFDARARGGGCLKDADDVRIFLLQARAVNVERMLVGLVADDQHRRLAAEGLDDLEPVLDAVFLLRQARIQHQQVETALGEEELVRGMHDLLPAEIPDVEFDGRLTIDGWTNDYRPPSFVLRLSPQINGYSLRFSLVRIKCSVKDLLDERSFTNGALSNGKEFDFV